VCSSMHKVSMCPVCGLSSLRRHLCPSQKHLLWHVKRGVSRSGHLATISASWPHPPRLPGYTIRAEGVSELHPHPCPNRTWSPRPGRARRRARRPPPPARARARSQIAGAPPASARAARATRRRTAARPRARPLPAGRAPARRKPLARFSLLDALRVPPFSYPKSDPAGACVEPRAASA